MYYRLNISNQRFDLRDATILDLIALAYKREDQAILDGPTWLDFDRFDVVALVPSLKAAVANTGPVDPTNPQANPIEQVRPVLQRVLADRFHLKYHAEDRPLPGYIFTVAKDGPKMAEAKDPTAPTNCQGKAVDPGTPQQVVIVTCSSMTMERFITMYGGVFPHPAVDHTGLKKSYDFTFKLSFQNMRTRDEYIHMYLDAFREIGLEVTAADVPQPAIVVDSVERPTPNPPEVAKLIPAMPDLEFEVASIRPAADTEPQGMIRPQGSQILFSSFSLQDLLVTAWQLPTGAMLGNAPPWLDHVRYTILVKLPPDIDGRTVFQNQDQLDNMLQKLLVDRFQIKYHWGEQTQDGWMLLPGTPRMNPADPKSRTFCRYGPPDGEKDMHTPDSPYDNQSHCQNVTMDQFADMLQNLAKSEIKNHVQNKTGLAGSYDFTFYYSSVRKLRAENAAAVAAAKESGAESSDPVAGMGIQDAFKKELGLKLEKQPGTYPALVLDHIEQTPTAN